MRVFMSRAGLWIAALGLASVSGAGFYMLVRAADPGAIELNYVPFGTDTVYF